MLHLALNSILFVRREINDLDKLTLISNECKGVIDSNGLLPVGSAGTLLFVWRVNRYSCDLCETHLMCVVVVHHMDDADLMDDAGSMEEGDFSPLQVYIIFLCL